CVQTSFEFFTCSDRTRHLLSIGMRARVCLRAACGETTVIIVRRISMRFIIAICAVLILDWPAARAQDVASFYRGKQLRFVVGSSVGGAYDLYARALARQIVHYIPGNPTIIVQNQPAAGGMVMTNQMYNLGPKDGTVIGVPLNGIPTAPMLQAGAQF